MIKRKGGGLGGTGEKECLTNSNCDTRVAPYGRSYPPARIHSLSMASGMLIAASVAPGKMPQLKPSLIMNSHAKLKWQ